MENQPMGQPDPNQALQQPNLAPKSGQKGLWWAIGIIAIVAILVVGGYYVWQHYGDTGLVSETPVEKEVRLAVKQVISQGKLQNPNEQMPKNIRLLSVKIVGNELTLNFSKEYISGGEAVTEDMTSLIYNAVVVVTDKYNMNIDVYNLLIEGKPYADAINITANWKTYKNASFEFKYPSKLTLKEDAGKVILSHSIPYKNTGCDMSGDGKTYNDLIDLSIKFDLRTGIIKAPTDDGSFSAGILTGTRAVEGVEGCGPNVYYFPVSGGNTLVISKEIPQQLSGAVPQAKRDEVLKVPGAISSAESEAMFSQILSTFKFVENSENKMNIKLYYFNETEDLKKADYLPCESSSVLSVERQIAVTQTPIKDTINLLLEGKLTDSEKQQGYKPKASGVLKLKSANLKDKKLILDFETIGSLGGSCLNNLIWTEISKTAKQFSGVETIEIMPESLLEP